MIFPKDGMILHSPKLPLVRTWDSGPFPFNMLAQKRYRAEVDVHKGTKKLRKKAEATSIQGVEKVDMKATPATYLPMLHV